MTTVFTGTSVRQPNALGKTSVQSWCMRIAQRTVVLAAVGILLCSGSQLKAETTPAADAAKSAPPAGPEVLTIREGDELKIGFPGTPTLDSTQRVRRDGRITLAIVGEIVVAGMTPQELEKDLIARYADQLVSKEVIVSVASSTFIVFVSGAVVHPGKLTSDHPLSLLEAVMESGGFEANKANMKKVKVIREENGKTTIFIKNLKALMEGDSTQNFDLKTSDIVMVPPKFVWF